LFLCYKQNISQSKMTQNLFTINVTLFLLQLFSLIQNKC
jgi:hypothetical protein